MNDERKKFYTDEPAVSIFDGRKSGRALSMRYSCNYPGNIVDQLRSSQIPEQCGTAQTKAGTGRNVTGTSSNTALPSGECEYSSSSDSEGSCTLPDVSLVSDAQISAGRSNLNSNPRANGSFASQVEEAIVRRNKMTEASSCTDSDSDAQLSTSGYVGKNKMSRTKLRKRRKKVTANLAGTRYDVGKR